MTIALCYLSTPLTQAPQKYKKNSKTWLFSFKLKSLIFW